MIPNALIVLGTLILMASLFPVRRLIVQLPRSSLRRYWYGLFVLIALFIVGYIGYGTQLWDSHLQKNIDDTVVPVIFFFGAVFVLLSVSLSLRTTMDLRRMALLEQENITDPLIGIYNRRYLDRRLGNEVARAKRYGLPLSVLMVDIDRFKQINDKFGHQAGDLVLAYLGKLILGVIRQTDIAARYGGEEIVIIAPGTHGAIAGGLAERLRQHIETHELVLTSEAAERRTIQITVSIGVAEMCGEIDKAGEIVACADHALYQAKKDGRNRVVVYKKQCRPE